MPSHIPHPPGMEVGKPILPIASAAAQELPHTNCQCGGACRGPFPHVEVPRMARQVLHVANDGGGPMYPNQASAPQSGMERPRGPCVGGHEPPHGGDVHSRPPHGRDLPGRRRRGDGEFPMPDFCNAGGPSASAAPLDIMAGLASRKREADKIGIPDLPSASRFRTWRAEVRRAVVAASAKPEHVEINYFAIVSHTCHTYHMSRVSLHGPRMTQNSSAPQANPSLPGVRKKKITVISSGRTV
eukprot:3153294-Amphidinium_carterae.1